MLEKLSLGDLYEVFGYLNDMLVRLGARRKRVVDVPIRTIYDDEVSGIEYRSLVPMLSLLLLRTFPWRLWVSYGQGRVQAGTNPTGRTPWGND